MNRRSFCASIPLLVAGASTGFKQPLQSDDKQWLLFDCSDTVPLDEFEATDSFEVLLSRISQEVKEHQVDAISVYVDDHWRWCPVCQCPGQPGFKLEPWSIAAQKRGSLTFQSLYDSTQVLLHSPRSRSRAEPLMFAGSTQSVSA